MMKVNHDVNNRNVTFSYVLLMDDEFFRTSDTSERPKYYLKAQDHCITSKKTHVNITLDCHQNDGRYRTEALQEMKKNTVVMTFVSFFKTSGHKHNISVLRGTRGCTQSSFRAHLVIAPQPYSSIQCKSDNLCIKFVSKAMQLLNSQIRTLYPEDTVVLCVRAHSA